MVPEILLKRGEGSSITDKLDVILEQKVVNFSFLYIHFLG